MRGGHGAGCRKPHIDDVLNAVRTWETRRPSSGLRRPIGWHFGLSAIGTIRFIKGGAVGGSND
jgi:hypothetical protein